MQEPCVLRGSYRGRLGALSWTFGERASAGVFETGLNAAVSVPEFLSFFGRWSRIKERPYRILSSMGGSIGAARRPGAWSATGKRTPLRLREGRV